MTDGSAENIRSVVQRLLIEAVEGCGVRHWARIDDWDGSSAVLLTDLGGQRYRLTVDSLSPAVIAHIAECAISDPLEVDSYLADEIIQSTLFGAVIYRTDVRRRPTSIA
ncbi:hypothetical protein [Gordonia sp. OPL2]|uniref:hypothetical protein n=1 Tax=Gordonia sp. OPL2 TaxID=2486274 RepID=UPI001654DB50|nr:hypothetical protein [Gordonia sp. OPL2]ROZ89042.1 hypothetical protein EEB19_20260 [Gordonia sp. OPL2]